VVFAKQTAAACCCSSLQLQQGWSADDEARVAAGTGCDNPVLIQQQLAAAGGDVDAAIEAIIEILAAEEEPDSTETSKAPATALLDATVAGTSSVGSSAGDQQQQATVKAELLASGEQHTDRSSVAEAAVDADTGNVSARCQRSGDGEEASGAVATTQAAPAASISVAGQPEDTAAAINTGTSSSSNSPAASAVAAQQDVAAAATAAGGGGHSKAVKLKGGSKLKHAKGAAAGAAADKRPSRNKPCPCGSGRKHKNCCELKGSSSSASSSKQQEAAAGLPMQLATLHI
jgi:hypothetical protein